MKKKQFQPISINKNDYLVAYINEKKRALVRAYTQAHKKGDWPVRVVVANQDQKGDDAIHVELNEGDILANVGQAPQYNFSIQGVKIEPWYRTIKLRQWGQVHIYRNITKKEWSRIEKAFNRCGTRLESLKLNMFLPITIEIRPKRGAYAGVYKFKPKDTDTIVLSPETMVEDTDYILYHECGHGVWFRGMNERLKSKWVKLYHSLVSVSQVSDKKIRILGKKFVKSGLHIKDFSSEQLDDVQRIIFDECIAWIASYHMLSKQHIDMLIDGSQDITDLWPKDSLFMSDMETLVSDYAKKSPEELFAEAFAYHMVRYKLPARVTKLMKFTLKNV